MTVVSDLRSLVVVLKERRVELGLSINQLADRMDVDRTMVHRWENGTRACSLENLMKWVGALQYDLTLARRS